MKFYDPDTHEIFEATKAEYRAVLDDYNNRWQYNMMMYRDAFILCPPVCPELKGHRHFIYKLNEEYTMIEFEDKYVHFRWTEELKGKDCFVADDIATLCSAFENGTRRTVTDKFNECYPFEARGGFRFAYYDPNYDCKIAFNEGKKIQSRQKGNSWQDTEFPTWLPDFEYRIKCKGLQWTDLKIGDVIRKPGMTRMITGINTYSNTDHIYAGSMWLDDEDLEAWEKV